MKEFWEDLAQLERQMDDVLRRLTGTRAHLAYPALPLFVPKPFIPALDEYRKGSDLVVRVELPGVEPEKDVHVQIEEGELVIRGERRQQEEVKDEAYYRIEAMYGAFERRIPIPEGVDPEAVTAEYTDGVLVVTVPGAAKEIETSPAREIPIKVAEPAKAA
jgi:HSP20 family protein